MNGTDNGGASARASLGLGSVISIIMGIIIGAGIYETPPEIYASAVVIAMTLLNVCGVIFGKLAQNFLTFIKVLGLIAIIVAGFAYARHDHQVTEGTVEDAKGNTLTVKTAAGEVKTFTIV